MAEQQPRQDFDKLMAQLALCYNKDALTNGWFYYASNFYKANRGGEWGDLTASNMLALCKSATSTSLQNMIVVGFSVCKNAEVFKAFFATLPYNVKGLFNDLVWKKSIDRERFELLAGEPVMERKTNQISPPTFNKEFLFFQFQIISGYTFNYSTDNLKIDISIPLPLRVFIAPHLPKPKNYELHAWEQEENKGYVNFSAETTIANELPALFALYKQGNIKYAEKGRPNYSSMGKLGKIIQLNEFYTQDRFNAIRCMLMCGLLHDIDPDFALEEIHDFIRHLINKVFLSYSAAPIYLFNFLKGVGNIYGYEVSVDGNKSVHKLFSQLALGNWVTLENLLDYSEMHYFEYKTFSDWDIKNKLHYELPFNSSMVLKKYIDAENKEKFVTRPFVMGCAFLFAAFGLLELCLKPEPPKGNLGTDFASEYEGLVAVRLTGLGAYVLGKSENYEILQGQAGNRLVFDDNSLVIRVEGNTDLAYVQLMQYAQKISANRYVFNQSFLMRDCKSTRDLVGKISTFKKTVGQKLPQYWEDYLEGLVTNSTLIDQVPTMHVYKLPTSNKELHRLFVQDEVLKKITIKAEKYHILVANENVGAFKARLLEVGILLC